MTQRTGSIAMGLAVLLCVAMAAVEARAEGASGAPPEPRITFHKSAEGVRGIKLRLYLKAAPERVWEAVTTPQKAAALFKSLASIRRSAKGRGFRDYHLNSIIGEKVVTCRVQQDDKRMHVTWKRVEGHLVELYGYYKVSQEDSYPGHTRLDYGSYIDPGGIGRVMMTNRGRAKAVKFMIKQLRQMTE